MTRKNMVVIAVLLSIVSFSPWLTQYATAAEDTTPSAGDRVVATVNGQPIKASELEAYAAEKMLLRNEALEELIELKLLRIVAAENHITAPAGAWTAKDRTDVEYALAKKLSVEVPPTQIMLVVDHAWVKDTKDKKKNTAQRSLLEKLRAKVEAGATIPEASISSKLTGQTGI